MKPRKEKTPIVPITGNHLEPGSKGQEQRVNPPEDIQRYVDSVPDTGLRDELLKHSMMVDVLAKERDGLRRYSDALKQQRDELETQLHDVLKSQRIFVATAAMQGVISNPNLPDGADEVAGWAIGYTDALLTKLQGQTVSDQVKTPDDASPKA
jgi:hypothetical protein